MIKAPGRTLEPDGRGNAVSSVVIHSSFSTFKAHGAVSDIANHGLLNIAMWGSHCIQIN